MILVYIILGLFILLWGGGLLLWYFKTTPEEKQKNKEFYNDLKLAHSTRFLQNNNDCNYYMPVPPCCF